jgi:hypothetical protein
MSGCSCLVVLIGEDTAEREWIKYEIKKAWDDRKGVLGIYIHNIKCVREVRHGGSGYCCQGSNPFDYVSLDNGQKLSSHVYCFNPKANDAYNDIANSLEYVIEQAISYRQINKI